MPANYTIDRERRLVISRAWGILSGREVTEHYRDIAADPAFDPAFAQLADLRQVEHIDMTAPTVRREALEAVFSSQSPRAFVTGSDEQSTVARLYGLYGKYVGQNVRVFESLPDAERWLGLAAPQGRGGEDHRAPEPRI